MTDKIIPPFGFPDFAETVIKRYNSVLVPAHRDSELANEMIATLPPTMSKERIVIYLLVWMTTTSWVELLTLVGNGMGKGALKIARAMFEASVMAEYLRQTPEELEDYIEYGCVLRWKRLKMYPNGADAETAAQIEANYRRVKPRFENDRGRVRGQWNKHSISYMAEKIGRAAQYELNYSLASSFHHGNFEALTAHLSGGATGLVVAGASPSLDWISQALSTGHYYLLQALDTLNDCFGLGFESRLKQAGEVFKQRWEQLEVESHTDSPAE
jgi:Family of unknown function (DUF5677)